MTAELGSFFVDSDQPPLSPDDADVVRRFHELYYRRWLRQGGDTIRISWFGYEVLKCPLDLWVYQELLARTQPDVVIETGTFAGGSALFIAMALDRIGRGRVISVDIEARPNLPRHPRIEYITGSSTGSAVVADVRRAVGSGRAMVILDSDHHAPYVYAELVEYAPLVRPGDYLIVEDTDVDAIPVRPEFGAGPMAAVDRFLSDYADFSADRRCERFLMTLNPGGFLRRNDAPTRVVATPRSI